MIHEVDETIRAFIRRDALGGTDIEVAFDAPTKEWSSRRNSPTVDLYLYDIREDVRRREVGRLDFKADDGRVSARLQPPRWFKLSYLLTAWTQRPEDEHRLLSACLGSFLRHDRLPPELCSGTLAEIKSPIPYTIALPPPEDRALSDVWSALGGELKPSLDLVVLAPFDLSRELEAGPPVREGPRIRLGSGAAVETAGGPRDRAKSAAEVAADRVRAEAEAAEEDAKTKGKRRKRGGAAATDGDHEAGGEVGDDADHDGGAEGALAHLTRPGWAGETAGAHEQIEAGSPEHPGRVFRISEKP